MLQEKNHSTRIAAASQLASGLVSGIVQAYVFNPWDRALYLSVKFGRPFLSKLNFINPMSGASQTVVQRAISSGLYFPLEDGFKHLLLPIIPDASSYRNFVAGLLAGAINGIALNPAARVKYHYWGRVDCNQLNFLATAIDMYSKGGLRPFFAGCMATVNRDVVFGGVYAVIRNANSKQQLHESHYTLANSFINNMYGAFFATFLSSPLNYVRNIHYSTPPNLQPGSSWKILSDLWKDMMLLTDARFEKCVLKRTVFLQQRLRVGWGTARVAVGMAFGSQLYSYCSSIFQYQYFTSTN